MTKYIPGAEPLFLQGSDKGLLLIHGGGGGTSWDLKEFAKEANNKGFTVWLPSLPGYGTKPEDLIGITVNDWLTEVSTGIKKLRETCQSVSIVGHSLGALLTLVSVTRPENQPIDKIVTWAAPWKINNRLLGLLPVISKIPLVKRMIPEKQPVLANEDLIKQGWVGYEWLPSSIGFVILDALKLLHKTVTEVNVPTLIIQGSNDEAVSKDSAQQIFKRIRHPDKELWIIEGATHPLMQDFCKKELFEKTITFLEQKQ